MADTLIVDDNLEPLPAIDPQRLAWGVLLLAFAAFCVIAVTSIIVVYYFAFQSSVSMQATLQVARGTVGVQEPSEAEQSERRERDISRGTVITTDRMEALSQATITFRDFQQGNRIVAVVTLRSDTSVRVRSASRPRFEWSEPGYEIDLVDFTGEMSIYVASDIERDVEVNIRSVRGTWMSVVGPGRYVARASETRSSLTNRRGEAIMISSDRQLARSVPEGSQGVLTSDSDTIQLVPALTVLNVNSELQTFVPEEIDNSRETREALIGWSCTFRRDLPRGRYNQDYAPDGRRSLRVVRDDSATANGEVRCEQRLGTGQQGIDVTGFDQLFIQTSLYVNYQSISMCGIEASECPLMLLVKFEDTNGVAREWYRGVYARDDGISLPNRCSSCFEPHILINEKTWYTFTSDNLFNAFGSDVRPAVITEIIFYASGHQYDVYVDEVALLAGGPIPTDENVSANAITVQSGN